MSFFKPDWVRSLKNTVDSFVRPPKKERNITNTPLQEAIRYQNIDLVSGYVKAGLYIDQLDRAVNTVFDHKDMSPRLKGRFVRLFIENGADVSRALEKARDAKLPSVEDMISNHIANGGRRKPQELPEARLLSDKKRGMLADAARKMLPAPNVQDKNLLPTREVDNTRKLNS